ncbi:MAG: hypothetical protein BWK78_02615 [Thiotrichaceae bacterium IS1]|nr:MAG: hypothetical protein BWK78_02615 [Thiotrichaceae bacterium IS1]
MKVAVVVGCNGQDGRIAIEFLSQKGYGVVGIGKGVVRTVEVSWQKIIDVTNTNDVFELLATLRPQEVYYFAAFHHSSEDEQIDNLALFKQSYEINVLSLLNFLEGMRQFSPATRLFYAASSLIFGETNSDLQDESTPFNPTTIYGITKLDGLMICRFYRTNYKMFVATGIFYNHESHYRLTKFISKKIINSALAIKSGKQDKLVVGDLNAEIDWGYAPDYVEAAYRILNIESSDEFVIATGIKHSVRDFVKMTFEYLNLNWQNHVEENPHLLQRKRTVLVGNPHKLMNTTGWKPSVSFEEMIKILLIHEDTQL